MSNPKPSPIILVLGAGGNIGAAVSRRFQSAGYRVALVSRSATESAPSGGSPNVVALKADLADPSSIAPLFSRVSTAFGGSTSAVPSVVVFNAATLHPMPEPGNALSLGDAEVAKDLALLVRSPYQAACEAFAAWKREGIKSGTFIYTSNILSRKALPVPDLLTLGIGKRASEYWIELADLLYRKEGYRFFVADERTEEGRAVNKTNGEAHADIFLQMAEGKLEDHGYHVTFSAVSGVKDFEA